MKSCAQVKFSLEFSSCDNFLKLSFKDLSWLLNLISINMSSDEEMDSHGQLKRKNPNEIISEEENEEITIVQTLSATADANMNIAQRETQEQPSQSVASNTVDQQQQQPRQRKRRKNSSIDGIDIEYGRLDSFDFIFRGGFF